ncbi:S-adenosyl-L-methionine-dependent methyltransferase [Trichodelitschia bisporula]|uniref:S-adenosyl-L-methionine-dependent methyltransferase n=1 Tax=Trichodelitschia bisporula TaxID=703511 RepID=A0A6G1HQB6_9PEZI|nr:S-adenosyl-L-methionine-dependent methyltransferase [Trichodelitschia bisporula]
MSSETQSQPTDITTDLTAPAPTDTPASVTQNIYDSPAFFAAYSQLPRFTHGLDTAYEWPTMRALLGSTRGCDILDLGCGPGWFAEWAATNGAGVHGIDVSESMLDAARARAGYLRGVSFAKGDLANLDLKGEVGMRSWDIVHASLVLHYVEDLSAVYSAVRKVLSPGGRFVFSVEHPVVTAPLGEDVWRWDEKGDVYWPLSGYWDEGPRDREWLGVPGVRKWHRTVETYLNGLTEHGFVVRTVKEGWEGMNRKPGRERKGEGHRPYYLMVLAMVPGMDKLEREVLIQW